jgi:type VI protein secretion system component VasK
MDEQQSADTPKSSRSETTAAVDAYISSRRTPAAASPGESPFAIHEAPKQVVDRQGHTVELKSRTPDEKARFRRRLHATVAIAGAAVLAMLLGSLLLL